MVLSIIYATYKAVLARRFNFMQHMFTNTTGAVYSYTLSTSGLDQLYFYNQVSTLEDMDIDN